MSRSIQNFNFNRVDFNGMNIKSKNIEQNIRFETKMYNALSPDDPPEYPDLDLPDVPL